MSEPENKITIDTESGEPVQDPAPEGSVRDPEGADSLKAPDAGGAASALPRLDFMKEQTKVRPLNKRKLLRRTVVTAAMAVLFGLVACLTLVLLEPVLNNRVNPVAEPEPVRLPPEAQEILPADMARDDDALAGATEPEGEEQEEDRVDPLEGYREIFSSLQSLSADISGALVTITAHNTDTNWLEGTVDSSGTSSGVIVADTSTHVLILAREYSVQEAESLSVTFHNGTVAEGSIRMADPVTGTVILEASKEKLDEQALASIKVAELGNSNSSSLNGAPVIALGAPTGIIGSVCYGLITSSGNALQMVDSRYSIITTDIYGSQQAQGVLANLQGQIIGVIDQGHNDSDVKNMISAIGISELRETIERLSNQRPRAYLGLTTADVSTQIHEEMKIPFGAYVTGVAMDSPAMRAGIQSGDVVVGLNEIQLTSQAEYMDALAEMAPEEAVELTIMREGREGYRDITLQVTLGELT